MPKVKLDEKMVLDLPRPTAPGGRIWYKDASSAGFGIVARSGSLTFFCDYRDAAGKHRRLMLGQVGAVSLKDARRAAKAHLGTVAKGGDPLEEKREARRVASVRATTLADVWKAYARDQGRKWTVNPATGVSSARMVNETAWEIHIAPTFGELPIESISPEAVRRWFDDLPAKCKTKNSAGTRRANQVLGVLRSTLAHAVKTGLLAANPVEKAHITKHAETSRKRYLSPEEITRLARAIDEEAALFVVGENGRPSAKRRAGTAEPGQRGGKGLHETESRGISPHTAALFRLLMATGARRDEIRAARWSDLDLSGKRLLIPHAKGGTRTIFLSPEALDIIGRLEEIRTPGHAFLIESAEIPAQPLGDPKRAWLRVLKRAGLEGVHKHDLRHTFASLAIRNKVPLPIVGKLLGHRDKASTNRYVHIADETAEAFAATIETGIVAKPEKNNPELKPTTSDAKDGQGVDPR